MNRNWVYSLFALWIVCSFACMQPKPVANVEVQKENFVFSIKGTDTLSLDKYELTSMSPASKKPVMIFAFGGGFKGGDKADKGYIPYFEFLARNGFVVVSTDYRTTLKNLDPSKVSSPMDFIAALQHAIDTAVEDFYDATGFVINQSSDWNIDVEQIVASGSSAGAITVLQAEYDLCNGHPKYLTKYPGKTGDVLTGNPQDNDLCIIRLSEIYLNAAEAAFKLGKRSEALGYLNQIVSRANPNKSVSDSELSLERILKERRKELVGEGHAFFDYMRNNIPVIRKGGWHLPQLPTDAQVINASDPRVALPIPQSEIDANPNIVQNKRNQQEKGEWH